MKHSLKQKMNKQLCRMAERGQGNSSSGASWGEVKLPECLRRELEEASKKIK